MDQKLTEGIGQFKTNCSICMAEIEIAEGVAMSGALRGRTPCSCFSLFHYFCIHRWLELSNSCPSCGGWADATISFIEVPFDGKAKIFNSSSKEQKQELSQEMDSAIKLRALLEEQRPAMV